MYGLGTFIAVWGGADLTYRIGPWAYPLTLVPLFLAVFLPSFLRNRSVTSD